jgi:methylamine dehydrogenase heavy chain
MTAAPLDCNLSPLRALCLAAALVTMPLAAAAQKAQNTPKAKAPPPPELPAETLGTATLDGKTTERVYVGDVAIAHIVDGRVRVFDARGGKLLGMIATAYAGNFVLSPKADEIYVATTYLSRLGRGERTDVLEAYDTQSLRHKWEIVLPAKRAQTLNYRGMLTTTANGRFALVQNATPATSVTVVDLAERKVAGEIPTPGCWGTLPSATQPLRFAMLCGDGKVATVTLDDKGAPADRQVSDKLFDADTDAWFATGEQIGDRWHFLSFKGVLHEIDVSGAKAELKSSKDLISAADARQGARGLAQAAGQAVVDVGSAERQAHCHRARAGQRVARLLQERQAAARTRRPDGRDAGVGLAGQWPHEAGGQGGAGGRGLTAGRVA